MESDLDWLQSWYRAQCNGVWEHEYGVKIDTLDNPGWSVTIDLQGTILERESLDAASHDRGPDDWMRLEVKGARFRGHGDPGKLAEILAAFRAWAARSVARGAAQGPRSAAL